MEILTTAQMRELEAEVAKVSSYDAMMLTAGKSAARYILNHYPSKGRRCTILCGTGNNGGDGYITAAELNKAGYAVTVIRFGESTTPQAKRAAEKAAAERLVVMDFDEKSPAVLACISGADVVVDALYGIGFHGELPSAAAAAIRVIEAGTFVFALDIPSGICADTGVCAEDCLHADVTFAFGSLKPAHVLKPAALYCGEVAVLPFGVPEHLKQDESLAKWKLMEEDDVLQRLPRRPTISHKGTFGRLIAVCGSSRYRGAALLSVSAALRCGLGLVALAAPEQVLSLVINRMPECTALPLKEERGFAGLEDAPMLLQEASECRAMLVGCGVGLEADTQELCCALLREAECQLILDADGLTAVSREPELLKQAKRPPIITPHLGEMARLCRKSVEEVAADMPHAASDFAQKYRTLVVLKGSSTIVAEPDGKLYSCTTGNPGLAKGGSGDVLAGMIAGLYTQGMTAAEAAVCGVWLHGYAADCCAVRRGETAMLPHELLEDLSGFFAENHL